MLNLSHTSNDSSDSESETETGLYYYRARYYDPSLGRFLREDSSKDVIRGMNFYTYLDNSSPNFTDPLGRGPWDWLKGILDRLNWAHETKEKIENPIDWAFCGLYYEQCLTTQTGMQADLAQALNSKDPVVYATALATLAQQVGANSVSSLKLTLCKNDENCKKALACAERGLTNPLPFPSSNALTDLIKTIKELTGNSGEGNKEK